MTGLFAASAVCWSLKSAVVEQSRGIVVDYLVTIYCSDGVDSASRTLLLYEIMDEREELDVKSSSVMMEVSDI